MRVILKLVNGRTKDLEVEGADTIGLVRRQVAAVTGVHPQHQRLILEDGVELADDDAKTR